MAECIYINMVYFYDAIRVVFLFIKYRKNSQNMI